MACHSRAAHDHRLDTVLVPQLSADVEDAAERLFADCRLSDRHFERPLTGEPVVEPHLEKIPRVPGDGGLAYGNDPEAARARERCEDTAFGNTEYRARGAFAADVQLRIAVAGDDEGVGGIVRPEAPQRHDHAFYISLRVDPQRTFG
jgi:hypothetical protein